MNTHLCQAVLLAGVISFGAATGRGQSLKATVPFSFQTANAEMPPGKYSVHQFSSGSPVIVLNNWAAHKSDMIMTTGRIGNSSDARPRMVFQCSEGHCTLAEIWGATSGGGVRLSPAPLKPRDRERLAVVYFEGNPALK